MAAAARSYDDSHLNLKATELRLGLPGRDEADHLPTTTCSTSRKRSSINILDVEDHESIAPPTKTQIVGWPPVKLCQRKNSFQPNAYGSALYVKVNMDGAPYLRKMDLKAYKGYAHLLKVLEHMFTVKLGQYSETQGYSGCLQSDYAPSYQDKDGDWMLVGDVPWEMFVSSCKRLRIIKSRSEPKGFSL